MKQNLSQKLFMTLALVMLATSVAWANYIGYTQDYIEANGLVFRRLYAEDPTGQTCTLVKPNKNNKNVYAECNEYGQGIGPAEVPEGMAAEVHVGPDGDEYTKEIYEIPSIVQGAKVVRIESDAFRGNTHLKSITFPAENLTSIPGNGFAECTALESLNFSGTSIKVIGTAAFAQCTALKKIEDWGQVETIHGSSIGFGYGCFGGCTALTELKIAPSVKYIYGNTFGGCTSLTKLIFEDGDDWLELSPNDGNEGAATLMFYDSPITYFYCGRKLTNNAHDNYIGFVNPLTTIEESVRKTIPKMEVEFGEKIDTLRNCVFRNMDIPIEVKAPGAVAIADYAFEGANVKSIDVPKIKFIDKYAFSKSKISEMNFYEVEEIGNYAFQHSRLTNVSLPATLKYVGVSAFDLNYTSEEANEAGNYDETSSLKTFTIVDGDEPIELGFDRGDYEKYKDETDWDWTIFVYSRPWLSSLTLEELYIGRPVAHEPVINPVYGTVQDFSDALSFRANSFPKLKKVELTKVTMIDDAAFQAGFSDYDLQSSLEEVSLPMLKAVPSQCFYNCPKLKKVSIPKVETIWDQAFAYASADLDLSFINTVDSIKENCFAYSAIGPELTIPATLKFLGRAVFSNCESLKKVTFEYGEKPLGMEYSFASNNLSSGRMVIGGGKCGIEELYFDRNVEPCTYIDNSGETPVTYTYRLSIACGSDYNSIFPNLKTVTIGKKLTSLNGYSFEATELEYIRCENPEPIAMEYIYYESDEGYNADHSEGYSFTNYVQEEVKLLVPDGSVSKYVNADVWKGFKNLTDSKGDLGSIEITIPKEGITTYSGLRNLDFSTLKSKGVKAYIASSYDADAESVQLSQVTDVTVDQYKEVGVVIKGAAGTYQVPVAANTVMSAYVNMLASVPSTQITLKDESYTYYNYSSKATLTFNKYLKDGEFVQSDGTAKVGPNMAYLEVPKTYDSKYDEEVPEVSVTLGKSGLTPLYPQLNMDFTNVEGLKAYCATGFSNSGSVTLTRVFKVPAFTPVLLKGTPEATYTVPSEAMNSICMNMLVTNPYEGELTIEETENSLTNFCLDGDKFKKIRSATTIAQGEVYLHVPTYVVGDVTECSIVFQESESTETSLIEDIEESITISDAKQVPYCSDKNLDFTDLPDLKAYVATGYDKSTGVIWLTRVKQVPAETGFLLMGDPGDYDIPTIDGVSDVYYKNMFKGTLEGTTLYTTDGDYTNYYLSKGDAGVGFYKVTKEDGVKVGANRCYLPILTEIPANGSTGDTEMIKVSAAKQVPYYTSKNLDFSSLDAQGVKAYTATGYNYGTGVIWLTRVKKVPAQTGILVMADVEGDYNVPTTSVQSVYENMFVGSETAQTIYTNEEIGGVDYVNYYLSKGDAGVGFYKVTNPDGVKMGANRCYLPIPKRDAASGARGKNGESAFCKMVLSDESNDDVIAIPLFTDGTTGIDIQSSIFNLQSNEVYYNLQGQRVENPRKGLYIHNGRRVVIRSTTK